MSARYYRPIRQRLRRSLAGPRHLLIRTLKSMRQNILFFSVYCWCTIVLLRALTGAGYVEGEDQNVELGGSSLFARFETSFMMESRRAREAAAGWGLEALRHGRRVSRLYPWVPGTDAEAAEDDIIGRLIFGEPSTVHTRSTLPAVSTAIISSA